MDKKAMLAIACGALTVSLAQAAAYTSTGTGAINDSTKWSYGTAPSDGDTNEWLIDNAAHIKTSGTATTFYGQTLTVQAGKVRPVSTAAASLTMNNMVLSGGTITTREGGATRSFTLDLTQDGSAGTFTLNSGNLRNADPDGSNLIFRSGVLAGSGTIHIEKTVAAATTRVVFENTISTVGFTGIFDVTTGLLELPPISRANASFGLQIAGTGKLYNSTDIAVTAMTLGTTSFGSGIYVVADLSAAGYGAFFSDPTGSQTITVVHEQTPLGMVIAGAFFAPIIRVESSATPINNLL